MPLLYDYLASWRDVPLLAAAFTTFVLSLIFWVLSARYDAITEKLERLEAIALAKPKLGERVADCGHTCTGWSTDHLGITRCPECHEKAIKQGVIN